MRPPWRGGGVLDYGHRGLVVRRSTLSSGTTLSVLSLLLVGVAAHGQCPDPPDREDGVLPRFETFEVDSGSVHIVFGAHMALAGTYWFRANQNLVVMFGWRINLMIAAGISTQRADSSVGAMHECHWSNQIGQWKGCPTNVDGGLLPFVTTIQPDIKKFSDRRHNHRSPRRLSNEFFLRQWDT